MHLLFSVWFIFMTKTNKKNQFQLCFSLCNIHFYTIISLRYSSWKRAASFKTISQSIFTVLTALRKLSRERSLSMFITSTKVGDTLVLITIHGIKSLWIWKKIASQNHWNCCTGFHGPDSYNHFYSSVSWLAFSLFSVG